MNSMHRRRSIAAVAGVAAAAGAVAMACTHGGPRPPGRTTTTATAGPPTTTMDTVPGTTDCGTIDRASGWPTTRVVTFETGPGRCFVDAWDAGRPARLVIRDQTDGQGGHPVVTTYDILGSQRLRVTTDATQAQPPGAVTQQECRTIDRTPTSISPANCEALPPAAPPFDGRLCGTIAYATGWPTTFPVNLETGTGRCFLDAWEAGTPARLVTREQTDGRGGHIRVQTWDVLGAGQLRLTTDRRLAQPAGDVTIERCTGLTHTMSHLQAEGCTPI